LQMESIEQNRTTKLLKGPPISTNQRQRGLRLQGGKGRENGVSRQGGKKHKKLDGTLKGLKKKVHERGVELNFLIL